MPGITDKIYINQPVIFVSRQVARDEITPYYS
jgi:hypothetical protein